MKMLSVNVLPHSVQSVPNPCLYLMCQLGCSVIATEGTRCVFVQGTWEILTPDMQMVGISLATSTNDVEDIDEDDEDEVTQVVVSACRCLRLHHHNVTHKSHFRPILVATSPTID